MLNLKPITPITLIHMLIYKLLSIYPNIELANYDKFTKCKYSKYAKTKILNLKVKTKTYSKNAVTQSQNAIARLLNSPQIKNQKRILLAIANSLKLFNQN